MTIPRPRRRAPLSYAMQALLTVGTVLGLAAPITAQEEEPRRHGHGHLRLHDPEAMAEGLKRKLDLTDEQRDELRGLMERFRSEHSDLIEEMRELRERMRSSREELGPEAMPEGLDDLRRRLREQRLELRPDIERLRAEIDLLLTPEQRGRLGEMREDLRHHGRRWHREPCDERHGKPEGG